MPTLKEIWRGCAEDAAMEVLKLQKENIKGLIIDLVDNGGGPWKSKNRNVYRSLISIMSTTNNSQHNK
jgi:C-terminal processing protease CtpA/Prc